MEKNVTGIYLTNPWHFPWLEDYPLWPFNDLELWQLGHIVHEVLVQEIGFPPRVSFTPPGDIRISARDVFLCAGLMMSPSVIRGGSGAWGFFLEHIHSLRPSPGRLRLNSDVLKWDERTRTVFAERFALGLTSWLMWKSHDVLHIADAGPFISKSLDDTSSPYHRKGLKSLGLYGKNGGLKPDLFCLTRNGECVIAESKGTIGPPSKLKGDKAKGKKQVQNVEPVGVPLRANGGRLVFATNLRHEAENPLPMKDSCICVVDPEGGDELLHVKIRPEEIVRHSYSKFLQFCGLPTLARILLTGGSLDAGHFSQETVSLVGLQVLPLLKTPRHTLGLEITVANALFVNGENIFGDINRALTRLEISSIRSNENMLVLPNGIVYTATEENMRRQG